MGTIVVWVSLGIVVLVIASLVPIWRSYRHLVVGNRVAVAEGSMLLKTASGPIEYATAGHGFPVLISHGGSGGYDQGLMTVRLYIGEGLMAVAPLSHFHGHERELRQLKIVSHQCTYCSHFRLTADKRLRCYAPPLKLPF